MSGPELLLSCWVPVPPTPKGRPRFSRRSGRAYTPAATEAAERTLRGELAHATTLGQTPPTRHWPAAGALVLELRFTLAIPASWSKKKRAAAAEGRLSHTSRPDVDNLGKLVLDAANGVLWGDDSQLVTVVMMKRYGATPGVWLSLSQHQGET